MSRDATSPPDTLPPPNLSHVGELVMVAEIADMFGVRRQSVDLWSKQPGFPEPVAVVKAGRIWRTADIVKWAEGKGRGVSQSSM
jgi:predicted DNA-binding transcriptional regulator AlpA